MGETTTGNLFRELSSLESIQRTTTEENPCYFIDIPSQKKTRLADKGENEPLNGLLVLVHNQESSGHESRGIEGKSTNIIIPILPLANIDERIIPDFPGNLEETDLPLYLVSLRKEFDGCVNAIISQFSPSYGEKAAKLRSPYYSGPIMYKINPDDPGGNIIQSYESNLAATTEGDTQDYQMFALIVLTLKPQITPSLVELQKDDIAAYVRRMDGEKRFKALY